MALELRGSGIPWIWPFLTVPYPDGRGSERKLDPLDFLRFAVSILARRATSPSQRRIRRRVPGVTEWEAATLLRAAAQTEEASVGGGDAQ
jgi:hypothetical protein